VKICYLCNPQSIHVQRWLEYFSKQGDEIHVITYQPYTSKEHNVIIHLVKRNKYLPIITKLFEVLFIRRLVKSISPDIVHAHSGGYGKILIFLKKYSTILSVWGDDVLVTPKKSILNRIILKLTLKSVNVITTIAIFMGPYIHQNFGISCDKIIRVPWGVDLSIFNSNYHEESIKLKERLGINKDSFILISNRNIAPEYQIEKIIKASSLVLKNNPNTYFLLIKGYGTPIFENKMKELANKLGVNKNLIFVSKMLTPEEMALYLNMADAFISIPKSDQFGLSVLEGMACGLVPILSDDIVAYKQYLNENNSIFVNPENIADIANRINYLINNIEFKNKAYLINIKIIEDYEDWNKNAKKMRELYFNIINKET